MLASRHYKIIRMVWKLHDNIEIFVGCASAGKKEFGTWVCFSFGWARGSSVNVQHGAGKL